MLYLVDMGFLLPGKFAWVCMRFSFAWQAWRSCLRHRTQACSPYHRPPTFKVQSSGGEKMLMLMLMLMVEATTWLPTLQFELLLVSACKFCNFESYLDNARRTWQGWWWWGATWWWWPPLFSLLWLPRRTSLLIFKYSTSSYNLHLSAIMLLNPDCVGRKWKLLLRGLPQKLAATDLMNDYRGMRGDF